LPALFRRKKPGVNPNPVALLPKTAKAANKRKGAR
jgi:hypothetical protein